MAVRAPIFWVIQDKIISPAVWAAGDTPNLFLQVFKKHLSPDLPSTVAIANSRNDGITITPRDNARVTGFSQCFTSNHASLREVIEIGAIDKRRCHWLDRLPTLYHEMRP